MSPNRRMTLVLLVVVTAAALAGYLLRHRNPTGPDSATPPAGGTADASASATASPTAMFPAPPTGSQASDTPAAWCAAAPNVVTVPPAKVQLLFSTATWRSCTTEVTRSGVGAGGVRYEVDTTLPVFWSANHAVDALNASIKSQVDTDVNRFLTTVAKATPDEAPGAALTLSEAPRINQVGRLAVIQFTGQEYIGGAHGGVIDDWINIDTSTWMVLTKDRLLLPAAGQPAGATRLAGLIAPRIRGMNSAGSCTTDAATLLADGQMPEGSITPASYEQHMQLGLQSGGELVVDFPPYYLFAYGCGVGSATLDLHDLDGLINPEMVALATATVPPEVAPSPPGG